MLDIVHIIICVGGGYRICFGKYLYRDVGAVIMVVVLILFKFGLCLVR